MWNLVCYIPLQKTAYWYHRHCDENLRNTSDNWKISQFWKSFINGHVQPFHGFNIDLSLFNSQTHWIFDTFYCRNAGIYGNMSTPLFKHYPIVLLTPFHLSKITNIFSISALWPRRIVPSLVYTLLPKDNITEEDILQLPELLLEEPKSSPSKTALTHEPEYLFITPIDKPKITLNDRAKKRKSTIPSRQLFHKQKKSEEAMLRYNFTKNPKFQFNLIYKIKKKQISGE